MSTGIESWGAESLSKIDALYPFVGSEVLMTIVCIVVWIGWQIWQIKFENNCIEMYQDYSNFNFETIIS